METLASGLAGHIHDFWVFVSSSVWLYPGGNGGVDYSNSNEALPYWFNGMVPLAYSLDDQTLKDQVHSVASTILSLQQNDGWLGPEAAGNRDFWARIPLLLGFTQLVEANSTWEDSVLTSMRSFMTLANSMLKNGGEGFTNCPGCDSFQWGQMRVGDMLITIQWLLERYPSDQDDLLWDNMQMFYDLNDMKWKDYYVQGTYQAVVTNANFMYTHGVNVGQGLKQSSVYQRFLDDDSLTTSTMNAVDWTFRDHGAASGTIIADEAEQGLAPWSGSELCTAVETGYSLTYLYQTMGQNEFADRAERVIYNAMPAMLTGDKWAHQYMIQGNQPWANNNTQDFEQNVQHVFTTANSGLATSYGMEPQYPCCTANHPQGYPKLLSNSWVVVGSSGLGHALLGPSTVQTTLSGGNVAITCNTNYPFSNNLEYKVNSDVPFDLYLRVPGWAVSDSSSVQVGNAAATNVSPDSKGMHKVSLPKGASIVNYELGATIRTETRSNNTIAVYYGAMHYALEITTNVTSSYPHAYGTPTGPGLDYLPYPQLRDYYFTPWSPWGVTIDTNSLVYHGMDDGDTLPDLVFDTNVAPAYITFQGCQIIWPRYLDIDTTPDWAPEDRTCFDDVAEYRLIPFGAAKLHMSDLPVKP